VKFPEPAASVLAELEPRLRDLLGSNLRGIYVYGSLAFGCYNPARSDVDVLVVTQRRLSVETRAPVALLLRELARTTELEISFLSRADLEPWRYPTPFDYHFSSTTEKHDGEGVYFAAEIAMARERSVVLAGPPAHDALPEVPPDHFRDCVVRDVAWARDHLEERPGYAVLNGCRVLAYTREARILSKAEGGEWGARELPDRFRPLAERALTAYRSTSDLEPLDAAEVRRFLDWVQARL
jgi:streptomycin 3"-adenylyltransferase